MTVKVLQNTMTREEMKIQSRMNGSIFQYDTRSVGSFLKEQMPSDAYCCLGLTTVDLYPNEEWNFVYGIASMFGRVGVVSFARYHPMFDDEYGDFPNGIHSNSFTDSELASLILRRSLGVVAHEIVHMLGIKHCVYYECLMNGCNHMDEVDDRPLEICPVELRKLAHCIGFDEVERYRALLKFYEDNGGEKVFGQEINWLKQVLE